MSNEDQDDWTPKRPDYGYWLNVDLWDRDEAVCLLVGVEPTEIKHLKLLMSSQPKRFGTPDPSMEAKHLWREFQKVSRMVETAVEIECETGLTLESCEKLEPKKTITWAAQKNFPLPEELRQYAKESAAWSCRDLDSPESTLTEFEKAFILLGKALRTVHPQIPLQQIYKSRGAIELINRDSKAPKSESQLRRILEKGNILAIEKKK